MFPGVQKSTWTYDKEARAWYFHRFYDFQPDLNTANPEVQAEIRRIMGFWLQLGVSGFRDIHYTEWGSRKARRTIVCVHGYSGNARDFGPPRR